ncbi:S-adenosyl-L-methionine:benzoic acid/salicylic acid carboxyl methyltransferase 3-like isoform X1 [Trifolium pratense]|uniref:S-adenosyl-L-methionine:benzoic acid/salicylic acid carboxyl methyltransferase 3-like isoform X1 n=1 Tax=Trifolium pratense TaxID=57577 RepID=UPI001E696DB3|nr:S-adenosyl-L-methionine:benzoic acid/salicylic acid carboxyl methyltransferase 3-like isoform X1 [Trifolium pratense]
MDLGQVLHMNGGVGEKSYANNSLLQQKVISTTKLLRDESIINVCGNTLPKSLAIADLGCSCGPNTLLVISETIKVVEKLYKKKNHKSPEYKIFLNDLPGNDFNTIFQSLDTFKENLRNEIKTEMDHCYIFGAPGSFYSRLFPDNSMHFVHSSYSLQFLSKVPEGVDDNKGNIYLSSTSPSNVLKAYYDQYKTDFSYFLKCRAQELVEGGCLFVTLIGRQSEDPSSKEISYLWDFMSVALNDMVLEGIIKEENLNSFNVPLYYPSLSEVKLEVLTEGSFSINQLDSSQIIFKELDNYKDAFNSKISGSLTEDGYNLGQCIRAIAEPLLVGHFGESVTKEAFNRFQKYVTDNVPKDRTKITNITMILTKRP